MSCCVGCGPRHVAVKLDMTDQRLGRQRANVAGHLSGSGWRWPNRSVASRPGKPAGGVDRQLRQFGDGDRLPDRPLGRPHVVTHLRTGREPIEPFHRQQALRLPLRRAERRASAAAAGRWPAAAVPA